ncbi:MAG TPA: hypothetical protein VGL46_05175 [Pseudonocardiaceae bacterium]|jgi:hypothetical protein
MYEMWRNDLAVLVKVVELCESNGQYLEPQRVLDAFPGDQRDATLRSLRRFVENDHINAVTTEAMGGHGPQILIIKGVTEKGLRASNAWPGDGGPLADQLLAVLSERAENEPDPEKRSRAKAMLQAAGGAGRDVLVSVVSTTLSRLMGGV